MCKQRPKQSDFLAEINGTIDRASVDQCVKYGVGCLVVNKTHTKVKQSVNKVVFSLVLFVLFATLKQTNKQT